MTPASFLYVEADGLAIRRIDLASSIEADPLEVFAHLLLDDLCGQVAIKHLSRPQRGWHAVPHVAALVPRVRVGLKRVDRRPLQTRVVVHLGPQLDVMLVLGGPSGADPGLLQLELGGVSSHAQVELLVVELDSAATGAAPIGGATSLLLHLGIG